MLLVPRREIIQNVFAISPDRKNYGTCFSFSAKGCLYLITAKHVIEEMPYGLENDLHIYKNNEWLTIKGVPYFINDLEKNTSENIDIAVIKTSIQAESNLEIELSCESSTLGQDVYFLGFPFFRNPIPYLSESFNRHFPIPLVKKATLSSLPRLEYPCFFLDGHNNRGFSGGPVTFWDSKKNKQKILGVVSSYLNYAGEIKEIKTSSSQLFYEENSGIAVAYNIRYAKDIIDQLSS